MWELLLQAWTLRHLEVIVMWKTTKRIRQIQVELSDATIEGNLATCPRLLFFYHIILFTVEPVKRTGFPYPSSRHVSLKKWHVSNRILTIQI